MSKLKFTVAKIEPSNDRDIDRITVFIKGVEKMLELVKDRRLRINPTVVPRMEEFLKLDRHIQTNSVGARRYNIPLQHAQEYVANILITRGNLTLDHVECSLEYNADYTELWLVLKEEEIYPQFGPEEPAEFMMAKIKPRGIGHIDGPKAFHIAIRKLLQMYDNGEIERLAGEIPSWQSEMRDFAALDPEKHFDEAEQEYDMEFMLLFDAVQSWDYIYFVKNGVDYGLEYDDDTSQVNAVPNPEDF